MESEESYMTPCEKKDKRVKVFRLKKAPEETQMVRLMKLDGVAQFKQKTRGFKSATNNVKKNNALQWRN